VSGGLGKKAAVDLEKVNIEAAPQSEYKKDEDASKLFEQPASEPAKKP
jgi:hypothetical protein